MRLDNILFIILGSIFAGIVVFVSRDHPAISTIIFDALTLLSGILFAVLYFRRSLPKESGVIIFFLVIVGLTIYMHVAYKISPIDLKHIKWVGIFAGLGVFFIGVRFLLGKK